MILFIISVGLSVTMGLMGFVNLAHGAFSMVGGYLVVTMMNQMAIPFFLALIAAFVMVAAISVVFERTLYRRLYGAGELEQVLFTIGLIYMVIAAVTFFWGTADNGRSVALKLDRSRAALRACRRDSRDEHAAGPIPVRA